MEKILVIGSNSFSGASFVDFILSTMPEMTLIGISRSPESDPFFLPYKQNTRVKDFTFYQLDLNHDCDKIVDLIEKENPSYIVNFAAQGMVSQSWENPLDWVETNVVSMTKLISRIYTFSFIKKFVQISTPEVYGRCENTKESMCLAPSTPYAASKSALDLMLYSYCVTHKFPVVYTRASNVFGPYQQLYRIVPKTIMCIKKGEKLPLHGGGGSSRNFIAIKDVAQATCDVMLKGIIGTVYHISAERLVSIEELVRLICDKMDVNFQDVVEIVGERSGKDSVYYLNTDKIRHELEWRDKISLEEGIDETLLWINDHFEALKDLPLDYIHKK